MLNSTAVSLLNFSAKLNIYASISATSKSREKLAVILSQKLKKEINPNIRIKL